MVNSCTNINHLLFLNKHYMFFFFELITVCFWKLIHHTNTKINYINIILINEVPILYSY